jgi:hypothetical protein
MLFPIVGTHGMEDIMGMYRSIGTGSEKVTDSVVAALMAGLEHEFGRGAGEALAHRFIDAEETDFLWDARLEERWLGAYESMDGGYLELERIAICGRLDDRWFAGVMIVDGDGNAHGMTARRYCDGRDSARAAMADAR